jgi:signal transduction histidine kinase
VNSFQRVRAWLKVRPLLSDALWAFIVGAFALTAAPQAATGGQSVTLLAFLLVVSSSVALVFRRRASLVVWGFTSALAIAGVSTGSMQAVIPALVALYTVATQWGRRPAILTGLGTAAAISCTIALTSPSGWSEPVVYAAIAWSFLATAIGIAVGAQRAVIRAAEDRALRAEQGREEEAQRRVTEERLRIARELHDVVAHHIAVISVQSGVARHLLSEQPDLAREALGVVRDESQIVLDEMSAILGLLRSADESGRTQPAPGLRDLDALVESMRRTGLQVAWQTTGVPVALSPLGDLAAYRLLQESLTNAQKHGSGSVEISVCYTPKAVTLDVTNPMANNNKSVESSAGLGLVGMRERVSVAGGTLAVGPKRHGVFVVHAELPVEVAS